MLYKAGPWRSSFSCRQRQYNCCRGANHSFLDDLLNVVKLSESSPLPKPCKLRHCTFYIVRYRRYVSRFAYAPDRGYRSFSIDEHTESTHHSCSEKTLKRFTTKNLGKKCVGLFKHPRLRPEKHFCLILRAIWWNVLGTKQESTNDRFACSLFVRADVIFHLSYSLFRSARGLRDGKNTQSFYSPKQNSRWCNWAAGQNIDSSLNRKEHPGSDFSCWIVI